MNLLLNRAVGYLLVIAATIGLVFSLLGIAAVWRVKQPLTDDAMSMIELADRTLKATSDGLLLTKESLTEAMVDVISLKNTLEATSRAINATNPMLDSLSNLLTSNIPDSIYTIQNSLATAQSSAQVIENFLKTVSSLPFLPIQPYDPPVPLHESLSDVSQSLDALPQSLMEMDKSLDSSRGNLILIEAEFRIMSRNVEQMNASLLDAQGVVDSYQNVVSDLQQRTANLSTNIPRWINNLTWFTTFLLILIAIAQLGLLVQGLMLIKYPRITPVEEVSQGDAS
jgi:methyl-accepting chemotaxis protein